MQPVLAYGKGCMYHRDPMTAQGGISVPSPCLGMWLAMSYTITTSNAAQSNILCKPFFRKSVFTTCSDVLAYLNDLVV